MRKLRMLMMMGCIPMILGAEEYKEPEKINLNKGWEFSADGDIIRNREWEWNVGLNLSKVKNKIGKLPDKDREEGITNGDFQKFKEGHNPNRFRGHVLCQFFLFR